jgi:hypothetical protein
MLCPTYRRSLQPSKQNIQLFKKGNLLNFFRRFGSVGIHLIHCNVLFSSETVAFVYDLFCVCSTLVYIKLLLLWVLVLVADYLLEFRSIVYSLLQCFGTALVTVQLDLDPGSQTNADPLASQKDGF